MKVVVFTRGSSPGLSGRAASALLATIDSAYKARPGAEFVLISDEPLEDLSGALERRGVRTFVFAEHPRRGPAPSSRSEKLFRARQREFVITRSLVRFIGEWRPDVVWTNVSLSLSGAVGAALAGVPHYWLFPELGRGDADDYPEHRAVEDMCALSELVFTTSEASEALLQQHAANAKVLLVSSEALDVVAPPVLQEPLSESRSEVFSEEADLRVLVPIAEGPVPDTRGLFRAIARIKRRGIRVEVCFVGDRVDEVRHVGLALAAHSGVDAQVYFVDSKVSVVMSRLHSDFVLTAGSEGARAAFVDSRFAWQVCGPDLGLDPFDVIDGVTGIVVPHASETAFLDALERCIRVIHARLVPGPLVSSPAAIRAEPLADIGAFVSEPDRHRGQEPLGIKKLPLAVLSWFALPVTTMQYLTEEGITRHPHDQAAWQVGVQIKTFLQRVSVFGRRAQATRTRP